jgi:hypothetical protein
MPDDAIVWVGVEIAVIHFKEMSAFMLWSSAKISV